MPTEPTPVTGAVEVQPASGVGKPFNFDAAAWAGARSQGNPVDITPIDKNPLVAQATDRISSLLSGELPDEVLQQVEIRAAEQANQRGIAGEAAKKLTFRDLGRSAMDAIEMGISSTASFEALRMDLEKTNRALELESGKLAEQIRAQNDQFALAASESDRGAQSLALKALEIQSANRQFRISEENRLIIANSNMAIDGLQQNMDSLGGSFTAFNTFLQEMVELNS